MGVSTSRRCFILPSVAFRRRVKKMASDIGSSRFLFITLLVSVGVLAYYYWDASSAASAMMADVERLTRHWGSANTTIGELKLESAKSESAKRESANRESAKWESEKRESAKRESAKRESAKRENTLFDSVSCIGLYTLSPVGQLLIDNRLRQQINERRLLQSANRKSAKRESARRESAKRETPYLTMFHA